MFHLLVCLCSSIPYIDNEKVQVTNFLSKERLERMFNAFIWILRAQCVQILFAKVVFNNFEQPNDEESESENQNDSNEEVSAVNDLFEFVIEKILEGGKQINDFNQKLTDYLHRLKQSINPRIVYLTVKKALLPFLRCSYLFFSSLTHKTVFIEQIKNKRDFFFLFF